MLYQLKIKHNGIIKVVKNINIKDILSIPKYKLVLKKLSLMIHWKLIFPGSIIKNKKIEIKKKIILIKIIVSL